MGRRCRTKSLVTCLTKREVPLRKQRHAVGLDGENQLEVHVDQNLEMLAGGIEQGIEALGDRVIQ
jgi:hypothetical protein